MNQSAFVQTSVSTAAPSRLLQLALLLTGIGVLAASSHIQVPMFPVPMTLQTLAVVLVGAFYGPKLGTTTVATWLATGALGLPVLAGGAGLAYVLGPTGGYLASFPIMALIAGFAVSHGCGGSHPVRAFAAFLLASLLCWLMGWAWLSSLIGPQAALTAGVLPFALGDVVKCALAAATLAGWVSLRKQF